MTSRAKFIKVKSSSRVSIWEYIKFAKLPISLVAFVSIVGLIAGPTRVSFASDWLVEGVAVLIYMSAFFFAAFSRPLRGYNWKQAMMLGLTITLSAQVLIVLELLEYIHIRHAHGIPTADLGFVFTALIQLMALVANAIIGSILGLVGWALGRYLPEAMPSRRSLVILVVGSISIPLLAITLPGVLVEAYRNNRESAVVEHMKDFLSAQQVYASENGGFYATLKCLSQPADCIPGFEGPPLLDRSVHGYRLDFYTGVQSDSGLLSYSYVAIPESRWLQDRAFCADGSGAITIYVHSKEKSGLQCDDRLYYTDGWPEHNYKGGVCQSNPTDHCVTDW